MWLRNTVQCDCKERSFCPGSLLHAPVFSHTAIDDVICHLLQKTLHTKTHGSTLARSSLASLFLKSLRNMRHQIDFFFKSI